MKSKEVNLKTILKDAGFRKIKNSINSPVDLYKLIEHGEVFFDDNGSFLSTGTRKVFVEDNKNGKTVKVRSRIEYDNSTLEDTLIKYKDVSYEDLWKYGSLEYANKVAA